MNGRMLTQEFLDAIDTRELSDDYASQRKVYECLDMAAGIFCRETRHLTTSVTVPTVPGQQVYDLPPDFIDLYMQSLPGRYYIRYTAQEQVSWPVKVDYEVIYQNNRTEAEAWPNCFAITSPRNAANLLKGTVSDACPVQDGRCILTDANRDFLNAHRVYPRDMVHNTTTGSMGIVLDVIERSQVATAIFGGSSQGFAPGDGYAIQAAAREQLWLPAPSLSTGHEIHIPYVCLPLPVFWDFGVWPFSARVCRAIAHGAAALFKTPKTEYREAQQLGAVFAEELKRYKVELGAQKLKSGTLRRRERIL